MNKRILLSAVLASMMLGASPATAAEVEFQRFFGSCDDKYGSETDLAKAVGECGIIQVITNNYNATNKDDVKVVTRSVAWGDHYEKLTASIAGGTAPDIAVMHRGQLANFVSRDLLLPLNDAFAEAGIDTRDFVSSALESVSIGDEIYGLPFDVHSILWHVNVDLMKEAGLVDADGKPLVPTSVEEFFAHATQFKKATGKNYLSLRGAGGPFVPWLFYTLVWQQGGEPYTADGKMPQLDTPEARKAVEFILRIFGDGISSKEYDSAGTQQAFLQGKAGNMIYGTWVVNKMDDQAKSGKAELKNYYVQEFPAIMGKPAVWSDSHMWVIPKGGNADDSEFQASLKYLKFIYDKSGIWARTGHLPVRKSVLSSAEYNALPFRKNIAKTTEIARGNSPTMLNQFQAVTIMGEEITAMYQSDKYANYDEMAAAATKRLKRILRR